MSASEKLRALNEQRRSGPTGSGVRRRAQQQVGDVLPQIVAVIEAAEEASARIYGLEDKSWLILTRSLAALEQKLTNPQGKD